jgi:beta-xylosidase
VHHADPTVVKHEGRYYLYPTESAEGGTKAYDVYESADLVSWARRGAAFSLPQGGLWAPDVFRHPEVGGGTFYLYYTADAPDGEKGKVIGVAVADSPLGPFQDQKILYRNAIDAHLFRDPKDGALSLYFCNWADGGGIAVVPMADPLTPRGEPRTVLRATEDWERHGGSITEGAWMLEHRGLYYLMYSGSGATEPEYAVGYATSRSPLGPFEKHAGNPIARAGGAVIGPGHHCVVEGPDGGLWMVYHQKLTARRRFDRFVAIDRLWFDEAGVLHTRLTRGTDEPAP